MSRVLVLGATGYIGKALCLSLLRSGNYFVYGLARTEAKASALAAQEIIPVLGTAEDSAGYLDLIRRERINVVVDASGANQGSAQILKDVTALGRERLTEAKDKGVRASKLGFIYTSGLWVYGERKAPANELDLVAVEGAVAQPPALVTWRPQLEQDVLAAADVLDVMVVRPSGVYGGASWLFDMVFGPLAEAARGGKEEGEVALPVEEDVLSNFLHVDDVGSGLHAAVDKLPLLAGTGVYPVFDLATSYESLNGIINGAAKALGYSGKVKFAGSGDNLFAKAFSTSVNINSGRAKSLLGWEPKRVGIINRIDLYASAWLASQKK